jgi:hypothetical protein
LRRHHKCCCLLWDAEETKLKDSLARKTFSGDDEVQDVVMTWLREQGGDFYDAEIQKKNSFPCSLSALRFMMTVLKSK